MSNKWNYFCSSRSKDVFEISESNSLKTEIKELKTLAHQLTQENNQLLEAYKRLEERKAYYKEEATKLAR